MSNIDKIFHVNQDLFTDLTEQDAEAINGGYETFTIRNDLNNFKMAYSVDGTSARLRPRTDSTYYYEDWTARNGGVVKFDADTRAGYQASPEYNLSSGRIYAFRPKKSTKNIYDMDLYDVT
jgi:hypothetical protein